MESRELQILKNKFDIIGTDPALDRALETAVAVAPTDLTVLITGESGVGKENIPKIIHQNSRRKNGKYFVVNCGAIPEGTIDSELFGHEKGSFTGAIETRKGYFEEANGGTLFLDEIGELPLASQAKLLRVLQSGEFIKVGSSKVEKTDVRVVAATNVNLLHAVSQGKFRADLYYRLNAIPIQMPSLKERKGDIYTLFRKFTSDFSSKYNVCKISLSHDAQVMLCNYRWPGNIRQLKNVAETVTALESKPLTSASERIELNAVVLDKYMPKDGDILPTPFAGPIGGESSGMSSSDKQMIIKAILDLKQEVDHLKSIIAQGAQVQSSTALIPNAPVSTVPEVDDSPEWQGEEDMADPVDNVRNIVVNHTQQEESFSLKDSYKDKLVKCLRKHHGSRKAAAAELQISERTVYRKIKEFGLEDELELMK